MSTITIPAPEVGAVVGSPGPSKLSVVKAVSRRMVPYLIEATLIPTALFYLFLITSGLTWAIIAALAWTFTAVARRIVTRRPIPGILMLATLGISLRTVVYLLSSNSFVYFLQPIARTVATAAFFALSVVVGRPLIARFAADFCELSPDVASRPAVVQLFRRLTYLWAAVNALAAAASLTLLLTVPVAVFVGAELISAWVITCCGVVLTVSESVRMARREGLCTTVSASGSLHAYATRPR